MRTTHWAAFYLTNPNSWYPDQQFNRYHQFNFDGTTEHTEDKGLGVNICCSSASALCQTGNNDGKSWNFPSYLYLREIRPVEPVSLERSDFEEQQENSGKQDEEEDGILENDSPSDDDDIPSFEQEADFYLER